MQTYRFSFLELQLDPDVQHWDRMTVTAYADFSVPTLPGVPKIGGRYRLGTTVLSADNLNWTVNLPAMTLGTGFNVSATLALDVAAAVVRIAGALDVRAFSKSLPNFPQTVHEAIPVPWPRPRPRKIGTADIAHVVVVMMENRSLDNLLGWLYADQRNQPPRNIPAQPVPTFDGLEEHSYWCPRDPADVGKADAEVPEARRVYATRGASKLTIPDPDPCEQFRHMTFQLFGADSVVWPPTAPTPPPPAPTATMKGFVVDYVAAIADAKAKGVNPATIMQTYSPEQVPVLTALARNYAVCDRWFASVPCQTWPNRAFVHAGTSCGRVNNLDADEDSNKPPDPRYYNTRTIFNVLGDLGVSWKVYGDSLLPTLTRAQFITQLANPLLNDHFRTFDTFKSDASAGLLPAYSFVEPDFMIEGNDAHPPHDVAKAERFLYEVWKAVSTGAAWKNTLLIITCDEHGGCYDHVPPPWTAVKPDGSKPQKPFGFNRYGVRVPTVVVSAWIEPGTVFRTAPPGTEFDHASILATLRDWQGLKRAPSGFLSSRRIANAPTLASVLTRATPRTDAPDIPVPTGPRPSAVKATPAPPTSDSPLNPMQRAVVASAIVESRGGYTRANHAAAAAEVSRLETESEAREHVARLYAKRLIPRAAQAHIKKRTKTASRVKPKTKKPPRRRPK